MYWRMSSIDKSNATGTFEFTVSGHASDFFPVNIQFTSSTSYCDIKVNDKQFINLIKCQSFFDCTAMGQSLVIKHKIKT